MDLSVVNWWAVAVCVAFSMASGFVWYNPKTFFMVWWRGIGKAEGEEPGQSGNMALTWILTVFASCIQAIFMALFVAALGGIVPGGPNLASGSLTGFLLWCGFVAPTYLVNKLFAGHGINIWAIEAGNHLLNFVVFGAILGAWR